MLFHRKISASIVHYSHRLVLPLTKSGDSGLTILELMIVVAIVGVLSAIAIPYYQNYISTTQYVTVIENLQIIDRECRSFNVLNHRFPSHLTEIGLGHLKDPWGNNYQYLNIGLTKSKGSVRKNRSMNPVNSDFDLYSVGPDGKTATAFTAKNSQDDIVRAENGKYYGWVKEY